MNGLNWRGMAGALAVAALASLPVLVSACPFCGGVQLTLSEDIAGNDVAVIAQLAARAEPASEAAATSVADESDFKILKVLKGGEHLGDKKSIRALYFGSEPKGTKFLVMGIGAPNINWTTPLPLSDRGVAYVEQLQALPEKGAGRLAFFQQYFEDEDDLLARDAYDEFAKAPYAEVKALGPQMNHDKLVGWIENAETSASRRRLYLTMLGICGNKDDTPMLEEMVRSNDRETKRALDAIIACYVTLAGPDGLPLIEELYLKNKDAEYTDTYAAIMAIRFHGQEQTVIPKERLVEALRHMLDRPQLADLVIPDLARWEDWSAVDRLIRLFKESDEESSWVRVPVINFLRACPLPEAKTGLDELAKIDPDAMRRASSFFPLAKAPAASNGAGQATDKAAKPKQADANATAAAAEPPTDTPANTATSTTQVAAAEGNSDATDAALASGTGVSATGAVPAPVDEVSSSSSQHETDAAPQATDQEDVAGTADAESPANSGDKTVAAIDASPDDAAAPSEAVAAEPAEPISGWRIALIAAVGLLIVGGALLLLLRGRREQVAS